MQKVADSLMRSTKKTHTEALATAYNELNTVADYPNQGDHERIKSMLIQEV